MDYTKALFNRTIWAIRGVSVSSNDLPERLAEVLAQMWRLQSTPSPKPTTESSEMDDSLMLKVRCRMTYLKNPTNPDSNAESSAASSVGAAHTSNSTPGIGGDPSLAPAPILPQATLGVQSGSSVPGLPSGLMKPNYEVFDPLNWLLDGLVDLPYSYSTISGMEAQGIA
ncbi:unnamed protein product [Aspergillus oryzae]|nr:unnamed protein product [Aspergillus oryzae]